MKIDVENVDKSILWVSPLLIWINVFLSNQILTLVIQIHNKMYGKNKKDIFHALILSFSSQILAQICLKALI